jgi:hypothetical protein
LQSIPIPAAHIAVAPAGFSQADIGVVRDNARQLTFKTNSAGFE